MKAWIPTLLAGLLLASVNSHAQNLKPEPGLWRNESTVLINGTDLFEQMLKAQQAMLDSLPAEQRATMQAMLGEMGDPNINDYCISAEEANRGRDTWRDQLKKDMPNCEIKVTDSSNNSMSFTGTCRDTGEEGFVGEISGDMQLVNSRELRTSFTGKGVMNPGEGSELPVSSTDMSTIETRAISRWIGSDCSELPEQDDD